MKEKNEKQTKKNSDLRNEKKETNKRASSKLVKSTKGNRTSAEIPKTKTFVRKSSEQRKAEELTKLGLRVSKNNKVLVNDLKTGYNTWIPVSEFEAHNKAFIEKYKQRINSQREKLSDKYDIPLNKTSSNEFDNIDSLEKFETLLNSNKGKIRNSKGQFMSKAEKESLLKIVKTLDSQGVEFKLSEFVDEKGLEKKGVKTKAQTPKDFFYWALQNNIKESDFGAPQIKIIDFDGIEIYNGKSPAVAASIMNSLNRKLDNLEKVIEEKEDVRPYFTIPVLEEKVNGNHTGLEIDYGKIKAKLKGEIFNKYKSML